MVRHVKTASGFECDIDDVVLDDMEVLDYIVEIERGNVLKYPALLSKLLTESNKKALYDHVRVDGRVPYSAMDAEITEIFESLRAKN